MGTRPSQKHFKKKNALYDRRDKAAGTQPAETHMKFYAPVMSLRRLRAKFLELY
jgi:hypothetical protein